jgi:hypothetical protein
VIAGETETTTGHERKVGIITSGRSEHRRWRDQVRQVETAIADRRLLIERQRHMTVPTNAPAAARRLTLSKPVKNTLDGSTVVKATRSPQSHVLVSGETVTLCAIDVSKWAAQAELQADAKVTCPLCAKALKG